MKKLRYFLATIAFAVGIIFLSVKAFALGAICMLLGMIALPVYKEKRIDKAKRKSLITISEEVQKQGKNQVRDRFFWPILFLAILALIVVMAIILEEESSATSALDENFKNNKILKNGINSEFFTFRIQGIAKRDDYWVDGLIKANEYSARIEQSYPMVRYIKNREDFSDIDDIIDFFEREDFGCCRQREPMAYWFLKSMYPDKEIKLAIGYIYCPELNTTWGWHNDSLDMNHVWLELNNRTIDVSCLGCENECYYHPYVYVKYILVNETWTNDAMIITSAIMQQFEYDQGLIDEVDLTVPWGRPKLNKKTSRNSSAFLFYQFGVAKQVFLF